MRPAQQQQKKKTRRSTAAPQPQTPLSICPSVPGSVPDSVVRASSLARSRARPSGSPRSHARYGRKLSNSACSFGRAGPSPVRVRNPPRHDHDMTRHDDTTRHDTTHMQPQPPEPTDVKTCCRPCSLSPHHTASHHTTPHHIATNPPFLPPTHTSDSCGRGTGAACTPHGHVLYCTVLYCTTGIMSPNKLVVLYRYHLPVIIDPQPWLFRKNPERVV